MRVWGGKEWQAVGTQRGPLTCPWEPGKASEEVRPVSSHKKGEKVSQVEEEVRKSEPGLWRDGPGPGSEREGLQWA